jgi:hypothetical protein
MRDQDVLDLRGGAHTARFRAIERPVPWRKNARRSLRIGTK